MSSATLLLAPRPFRCVKCHSQNLPGGAADHLSIGQSGCQPRAAKISPLSAMATSAQRVVQPSEPLNGATHAQPVASQTHSPDIAPPSSELRADEAPAAAREDGIATTAVHAGMIAICKTSRSECGEGTFMGQSDNRRCFCRRTGWPAAGARHAYDANCPKLHLFL